MTDDTLPIPRPDLAGFVPYRTQQMRAEVRLQANEWAEPNPVGRYLTSEELERVLLNRYPGAGVELREALASRDGVGPDQLIFGNGSNEVLLYTFLVFGGAGRSTLVFQPTYSMHARLTQASGGTAIDERIGLPYELTPDRVRSAIATHRPNIVVICAPNNPTGTFVGEEVVRAALDSAGRALVVVDEAYSDFAGTSVVPLIRDHPNLVVVKTFSKVRAAAGLRLGWAIAHPRVADMYHAVELPYSVSAVTLAIGAKIAKDDANIARRIELCRVERERVIAALRRVPEIETFDSVTNFVLFRLRSGSTSEAHAGFLRDSVLVRDISTWPGCESCLRVSIGTPEENDRFIAALPHVFAAASAR